MTGEPRPNPLDELAEQFGIEEEFRDALGEVRQIPAETKRALLAAMRIPVATEGEAMDALREREAASWRRALPHARVARSTPPITVEVVIPAGTTELRWTIALEDGGERKGEAECGSETLVESREREARIFERHWIRLAAGVPHGYHLLRCDADDSVCRLIVTPERCWMPEALQQGRRLWGICAQLYLLRSGTNWGIGDYTDLARLVEATARLGGDAVGLNPLHSGFLDRPEHASPYSPESRLLLNVLNIDVAAVPELEACGEARQLMESAEFRAQLDLCRAARLVDYAGVAGLKFPVLRLLYEEARRTPESERWRSFRSFCENAREGFQKGCLYEALRQHFAAEGRTDWHTWPREYRDGAAPALKRFAEENGEMVGLYEWMQWVADEQLGAAAAAAKEMRIGLYRDLAVGTDRSGAEPWSHPETVVSGAHTGAPPDRFNPTGQDWGLPPCDPHVLYETGYGSFIEVLRANMRHAGALRIDHVMALRHVYWVPEGRPAREGAYVRQPMEDLIGILALESHRNQCLVVGEDLGTVPEGFRERMMAANILSYRVLFFEQEADTGAFLPGEKYPQLAVAVAGSHDLPTIRGWWKGIDIDIQERLKLFPTEDGVAEARQRRERDRGELVRSLRDQKLLPAKGPISMERLAAAVHGYLARTGAKIVMAQLDDVMGETEPVNVPATCTEHPNWRRRMSLTLEELPRKLEAAAKIFRAERGEAQAAAGRDALI